MVKGKEKFALWITPECKKREARMGRNPKTKEAIEIPATTIPVFKAGKALKEKTAK